MLDLDSINASLQLFAFLSGLGDLLAKHLYFSGQAQFQFFHSLQLRFHA